jgi:hypothetical protein
MKRLSNVEMRYQFAQQLGKLALDLVKEHRKGKVKSKSERARNRDKEIFVELKGVREGLLNPEFFGKGKA